MFYSVASPDWKPGQSLAPAGALLFRTRAEAEAFLPGGTVVTVPVRFDQSRSRLIGRDAQSGSDWSIKALANAFGGLTIFEAIPGRLLSRSDLDSGAAMATDVTPSVDFGGWDTMTMALMA